MRTFAWTTVVVTLFGTAACGGGSTGTIYAADTVAVQGKLVTRDGSASTLDGVVVTCPDSGTTDVTDGTGAFQIHVPPNQPFHLDFDDPMWPGDGHHHDTPGDRHDPFRDGAEVDGNGVTLSPVGGNEWCEIEVHLEDGEIVECHVRRRGSEDEVWDGERRMERDPLCDEVGAMAEIEISVEDGCLVVEVEVDGFSGPASLDIHFVVSVL